MTIDNTDVVRVTGPAGLLTVLPVLIGFVPTESIVATVTDDRNRSVVTARMDLDGTELDEIVDLMTQLAQRAPDAHAVIFTIVSTNEPPTSVADVLVEAVDSVLQVRDVLYTDGITYKSMLCHDPHCDCSGEIPDGGWVNGTRDDVAAKLAARVLAVPVTVPTVPTTGVPQWRVDTAAALVKRLTDVGADDDLFADIEGFLSLGIPERDTFMATVAPCWRALELDTLTAFTSGMSTSTGIVIAAFMWAIVGNGACERITLDRMPAGSRDANMAALLDAAYGLPPAVVIDMFTELTPLMCASVDEAA